MSKPVKDLITREYARRYDGVDSACLVSVVGLDAISTNQLRGELRSKQIRLQVIKNSLGRRAFMDSPLEPLAGALEGPCALAVGGESIIDVARILVELKRTYPAIELKQGMLDGDPELIGVADLARMKTRVEMLGEVAMLITSPARRLAGCLTGPGGRIAGCLEAMAGQGDDGE